MMNMMAPKKKMSTLILDFDMGEKKSEGKKQEGEETNGEDYPMKVAGNLIDAVKSGDKKKVLSAFQEMMSCCNSQEFDSSEA